MKNCSNYGIHLFNRKGNVPFYYYSRIKYSSSVRTGLTRRLPGPSIPPEVITLIIYYALRKDWIIGLFGRAFDTARADKVDYILCVFRKDRIIVLSGRTFDVRVDNFGFYREFFIVFFYFFSNAFSRVFRTIDGEFFEFSLLFPDFGRPW